ncbi:hypothetical protein B0H13DRAFT_2532174, partial [Mycena leptocephala]
ALNRKGKWFLDLVRKTLHKRHHLPPRILSWACTLVRQVAMLGPVPPTYLPRPPLCALLAQEIKRVVLPDSPATRPPGQGDPQAFPSFQLITQPKPPPEQGLLTNSRSKPLWQAQVLVSATSFMQVPLLRTRTLTALRISLFCRQPLRTPAPSSAAESDDENPQPRRAAARKKAPGRRCGRGATAAPTPRNICCLRHGRAWQILRVNPDVIWATPKIGGVFYPLQYPFLIEAHPATSLHKAQEKQSTGGQFQRAVTCDTPSTT